MDFELERFLHLYCMNRGILLKPFHNNEVRESVLGKAFRGTLYARCC